MKKSEMIELLEETIQEELYKRPPNDYPPTIEFAELVLNAVQKAGMLPPRAPIKGTNFSDNYWEPEE